MQDEELDHIIRDAVEKHHPAYNDKAWGKMEKKLDKHLPQKEDRRRYIFFLLLFLLLGSSTFLGISYFNKNKNTAGKEIAEQKNAGLLPGVHKEEAQINAQPVTPNKLPEENTVENLPGTNKVPAGEDNKKNPVNKPASVQSNIQKMPDINTSGQIKTNPVKETARINTPVNSMAGAGRKNSELVNTGRNKRSTGVKKGRSYMRVTASEQQDGFVKNEKPETKTKVPLLGRTIDKTNIVVTPSAPEMIAGENKEAALAELKKVKEKRDEQKNDPVKAKEEKKEKELAVTEKKTTVSPDKKKPKKNKAGNFGLTFSAGTDLSFIELSKLGKATFIYGAGLSYNFGKRITARAGFYASKKIYTATPEQYYIPPGSYYPGLYEVDAVCKVYEIPVSFSYHFWQRKNHNWFGNAGLSSFLMKNEKYDYQYKTAYGPYTYKTEIKDKNKHYFAVLTLSAGYQYRFNKWISLQAEPFVKLPLAGVGQGKIKLKSSGLLFTVTLKPFAKRN